MTLVSYLITLLAILSLGSQIRSIYRTAILSRDWLGFYGIFVVTFGGLLYETGLIRQTRTIQLVLLLVLMAFSAALVLRALRAETPFVLPRAALLPATASFLMFFANALMNEQSSASILLARLLPTISLIALALMLSMTSLRLTDVCRILVLGISLIFSFSLLTSQPWRACDKFKCGPFGELKERTKI